MAKMEAQDNFLHRDGEALVDQNDIKKSLELQVIVKAQEGNAQAIEALIEQYSGIVYQQVKGYVHRPYYESERDQLVSVGYDRLYEAIFHYEPTNSHGLDFSSFVAIFVQSGLHGYVANQKPQDAVAQKMVKVDSVVASSPSMAELELQVLVKAQSGDKRAENALIEQYANLVFSQIRKYANRPFYYDEKEDLEQVGNETLYKAIKLYRIGNEEGAKFSTYATMCIKRELQAYVSTLGFFKKSREKFRKGCAINRMVQEGFSAKEIAMELVVKESEVLAQLHSMNLIRKLEAPTSDGEHDLTMQEVIGDDYHNTEEQAIHHQLTQQVQGWIAELDDDLQQALMLRYGDRELTYEKISETLATSSGDSWNKEGARQAEQKALKKIRYFIERDAANARAGNNPGDVMEGKVVARNLSSVGLFSQGQKVKPEQVTCSRENTPKKPTQG